MKEFTLGIIREGKTPPDERVPFSPEQLAHIKKEFPSIKVIVESSDIRCFSDEEYQNQGVEVVTDISQADVLMGVKEVPKPELISNKTYFFFSHTIKKQPYNRELLQKVLEKNIELIDYECLVKGGRRILGFGRYAGIVGCYNSFLAYGKRYNLYDLKPAHECTDKRELESELSKVVLDPNYPLRIALTGNGRVAHGAMEILDQLGIPKITVEEYLKSETQSWAYCQLKVTDYNMRVDGSTGSIPDFFEYPERYASDFMRFAAVTDMYIACHYWKDGSPFIFTRDDAKRPEFKIKVVGDISCDIDGPVASTLRPSTIEDPLYGYDPYAEAETPFDDAKGIAVMAVDNLPCELPRDASTDFGAEFIKNVLPAFANDADEILKNATIAKDGQLTEKFLYLSDYVGE